MITTVIVYAQENERKKIISLFSSQEEIKIIASGKDSYDALKLAGSLRPDIVIIDNQMDFIEGQEIPPLIRARSPFTAVVLLIAKISDNQLLRAAQNEVSGFVNKETDLYMLPSILLCVARGECFISPSLAARILLLFPKAKRKEPDTIKAKFPAKEDPTARLSKMELCILTRIGQGYSSEEIADDLALAVGTVRNHISAILRKTGLHSRSQMVCYAYNYSLIPADM